MNDSIPQTSTADHDLLIEVNTNVKNLSTVLTAYTNSNDQLTKDHETRIRTLEATTSEVATIKKTAEAALKAAQDVDDKTSDISLIRKLVYSAVGVILLAVLTAVVALVVISK